MEKIKDFIYDHTDLLLSLMVVSAILFIIGANFTFFDRDLSSFIGSPNNDEATEEESLTGENRQEPSDERGEGDSMEEPPQDPEDPEDESDPDTVTVEIPQGATASDVGDVLSQNNLVENTTVFVQRSEDLNVSHRLRPGTFEIPEESSIEEIIQILIQSSL